MNDQSDKRFGVAEFAAYIDAFNRDDFDGYARFYHPDVQMSFNGGIMLNGTAEIGAFYEKTHRRLRQHITVDRIVHDEHTLFADLTGEFLALEDYPDFSMLPLERGDRLRSSSLAHYHLDGGRIRTVVTARYRLESFPRLR